jgi:hypothetical protein
MHDDNALLPPTIHLGYLTDDVLITHVSRARESLRFVGPGMSLEVAKAFVTCWRRLPPAAIELILDADSDLCRLGFIPGRPGDVRRPDLAANPFATRLRSRTRDRNGVRAARKGAELRPVYNWD